MPPRSRRRSFPARESSRSGLRHALVKNPQAGEYIDRRLQLAVLHRGAAEALPEFRGICNVGAGPLPEGVRAFPGSRGSPESLADDAIHTAWVRPSPLALTDAGRKAAEGFDPSSSANPRLRCEPTNILFDWTFETFTNRITQDENAIRIQYGAPGIDRTVYLHETAHPANIEPSVPGHSIGHWEDGVLVVDTVGFKPGVLSAETLTMHSGQLHVVERFTLDAAKGALRRDYVATDPLYFAGEYKGSDTVYTADLPYETPTCDDLSYASDRGTRAVQQAVPETPAATGAVAPAAKTAARPWWMFWKDWF